MLSVSEVVDTVKKARALAGGSDRVFELVFNPLLEAVRDEKRANTPNKEGRNEV